MDNVIKQGYLRKAFSSERGLSNLLDKIDPNKWFVFLVRQGKPILEYYDKETDVFSAEPINTFDLSTCKQVTFTFLRNARIHTFNIILGDRVIELATTSREMMISWCDCLESTLQRLGILRKEDHEHVYSFCPAVVNKIGHANKDEQEEESKEEEGATANYSVPDEDIFGTVRAMQQVEETEKEKTERDFTDELIRKVSNASLASEEDTSDYSGDFVGREFFQKHRITLKEKKGDSLGRSVVVKSDKMAVANIQNQPKTVEDSNNNTNSFGSEGKCIDDLDDGYSELTNWLVKDSKFGEVGQNGMDVYKNVSPPNQKTTVLSHIKNQGSLSDGISKEKLVVDLPKEASCSNDSGCRHSGGDAFSAAAAQDSGLRGGGARNSDLVSNTNQRSENLYSAFPGAEEPEFSETFTSPAETSLKSVDPLPRCVAPSNKPIPRRRTHVPHSKSVDHGSTKLFKNWETFESDVPSPICSVPPSQRAPAAKDLVSNGTACIPPLPPRFDSLPSWCSESTDDTMVKHIQDRPMPRVPSPVFSHMTQSYTGPSSQDVPPIPPRRDSRGGRAASTSDIPPPLPARRSQSFRIQRPITSPPNLSGDGTFSDHPPPTPQDIDDAVVRRPDRQLSIRMRMARGQSAHTVISLKHNQIDILQGEMFSAGVALELTPKSCQGIALVDINKKVWIGGWNWKDFPRLHSKFHVGDELLSINSQPVENAHMAMKTLKHASKQMEVVVRRIPNAKVFEIRRSAEGQSLGIRREGGTGEILYVDPNGLAAKHGLLSKGECVLNPGHLCSWYMTEINSRPVSLYFKDLEIEHRLNAVGLEISFVVQPSDFITEIKKQIKKMKNYKSYIPQ